MIKALMIEDDGELAEILTDFLATFDIKITNYQTPDLGIAAADFKNYDIVILDLSLPDMDGLDVCKILLKKHNIPIIISSARSDIQDKIQALEMGAEDYLPKPYDPRELVARIHKALKAYKTKISPQEPKQEIKSNFVVNEDGMEILHKNKSLKLTKAEYGILKFLLEKKNCVVSREDIINNVDAINYESCNKSIDVIVSRIRSKIEENTKKPKYIESVRGIGYKLSENDQ